MGPKNGGERKVSRESGIFGSNFLGRPIIWKATLWGSRPAAGIGVAGDPQRLGEMPPAVGGDAPIELFVGRSHHLCVSVEPASLHSSLVEVTFHELEEPGRSARLGGVRVSRRTRRRHRVYYAFERQGKGCARFSGCSRAFPSRESKVSGTIKRVSV